jgi:hypothetical protein
LKQQAGGSRITTLIVASARQESAMKRTLILAVTLWLGVSGTTHAQVNSPTNAASTVTGAVVPSGQGATGVTGGGFSIQAPVLVPCPFGASLSAALTAFGCASDPLGAPTYQIPAEAGAVITGPVGIGANAHTVNPTPRRALVVLAAVSHRARAVWAQAISLRGPSADARSAFS